MIDWVIVLGTLGILIPIILAIVGWFFQEETRILWRFIKFFLSNKHFQYNLVFKAFFPVKPIHALDYDVYSAISSECDNYDVSLNSVQSDTVILIPNKLGRNKILVHFDSIRELLSEEEPDEAFPDEYTLTIKLDNDLGLGMRDLEILHDYASLFGKIREIIQRMCFNATLPTKSFLLCDIIRDLDTITSKRLLEDLKEDAKVTFQKQNITLTLNKPEYLLRLIKRYIGY